MSIWFRPTTIEQVQATFGGVRDINLHLDIRLTEIGDDFLRGSIPLGAASPDEIRAEERIAEARREESR